LRRRIDNWRHELRRKTGKRDGKRPGGKGGSLGDRNKPARRVDGRRGTLEAADGPPAVAGAALAQSAAAAPAARPRPEGGGGSPVVGAAQAAPGEHRAGT